MNETLKNVIFNVSAAALAVTLTTETYCCCEVSRMEQTQTISRYTNNVFERTCLAEILIFINILNIIIAEFFMFVCFSSFILFYCSLHKSTQSHSLLQTNISFQNSFFSIFSELITADNPF